MLFSEIISNTFTFKDMSILSIPVIQKKKKRKKKSEGASGHCFQPKPLGTFAELIPQCSDELQCPLPEDPSHPATKQSTQAV